MTRANIGGVSKYVSELARGLIEEGHQVLVVTGKVQKSEIEDASISGLQVARIPSMVREISPILDIESLKTWRKIVTEFKPEIIHSHMSKAGFISRITSRRFYKKNGNPIKIHTYHGHSFSEPEFRGTKRKVLLNIERILANKSDSLISVGHEIKQELIALKISKPNNITSIAPGIKFPQLKLKKIAKEKLKIENNKQIVAWIGRLTSVKNPWALISIAKARPEITFLMAGGGEFFEKISEAAPENVKVLGWSDTNEILSASDLVVLTSHHEGMPLTLIEAQMAGKPVISTNVGAVGEIIETGLTGILCSIDEMPKQIDEILKNTLQAQEMGSRAASRAQRLFTIENMVQQHQLLYAQKMKDKL
jgi:glycosyltransferase involved in cell wall biosynthesis